MIDELIEILNKIIEKMKEDIDFLCDGFAYDAYESEECWAVLEKFRKIKEVYEIE